MHVLGANNVHTCHVLTSIGPSHLFVKYEELARRHSKVIEELCEFGQETPQLKIGTYTPGPNTILIRLVSRSGDSGNLQAVDERKALQPGWLRSEPTGLREFLCHNHFPIVSHNRQTGFHGSNIWTLVRPFVVDALDGQLHNWPKSPVQQVMNDHKCILNIRVRRFQPDYQVLAATFVQGNRCTSSINNVARALPFGQASTKPRKAHTTKRCRIGGIYPPDRLFRQLSLELPKGSLRNELEPGNA